MRSGDEVLHNNETLTVGYQRDWYICALGWPCDLFPVSDCVLTKECTDEEHMYVLSLMAAGDPLDPRALYAKCTLDALVPPVVKCDNAIAALNRIMTQPSGEIWGNWHMASKWLTLLREELCNGVPGTQ